MGRRHSAHSSGMWISVLLRPWLRVCSLTVFTMPVASVLTKCLEEASRIPAIHPGSFKPQCDENGNYMPLQCFGSIGYCWCVFPNGTEVPHTRSRGRHNCSGKQWPLCQGVSKEQEGLGRLRAKRPRPAHMWPGHSRCKLPGGSHSATHPPFVHLHPCALLICSSIYPFSPYIHTHLLTHSSDPFTVTLTHPCTIHCASRSPTDPPISSHHPLPGLSLNSPTTFHCRHPARILPSSTCSPGSACAQVGKK